MEGSLTLLYQGEPECEIDYTERDPEDDGVDPISEPGSEADG